MSEEQSVGFPPKRGVNKQGAFTGFHDAFFHLLVMQRVCIFFLRESKVLEVREETYK